MATFAVQAELTQHTVLGSTGHRCDRKRRELVGMPRAQQDTDAYCAIPPVLWRHPTLGF